MDDIVISGISGRFPESDTVEELARILYDGFNPITEDDHRWPRGIYDLPKGIGKIKNLSHFDADFFGVSGRQAQVMDPQGRLLLEASYEALADAGVNFSEFRGSNTGVFIASAMSDAKEILSTDVTNIDGYELIGCLPSFLGNRVSHSFDFKGPSLALENGCASGLTAFVQGVQSMRANQCDAAIIGGTNILLSPITSKSLDKLGVLSPDSKCKAFSADGNGYVRGDCVVAILLQKRADAKRVYATVRGTKINADGYKVEGFSFPSEFMQCCLLNDTLKEAGVDPNKISYFEAHGSATPVGDAQELSSIVKCYCNRRNTPLLIGSLKSNIGHTESSAGVASIVKVILAMESGVIPGNLHYSTPNPKIPALVDGRLKVINRNTPWEGGLAAINCFGFGGSNGHIIIESNSKPRPSETKYEIPRLLIASGRTHAAVKKLLELGYKHPNDAELHALLDAIHTKHISGHTHRGYAIIGDQYLEKFNFSDNYEQKPIWFVFTNIDSEWDGAKLKNLLHIPSFKGSIEYSAETLRLFDVDVMKIFERHCRKLDVLETVVLQVALVNVLRELEIQAEGFLGYSFGEIGCAYSKGLLSAEQALICGYWCRRSIEQPNMLLTIKEKVAECIKNSKFEGAKIYHAQAILNCTHSRKSINSSKLPDQAVIVEIGSSSDLINELLSSKPTLEHVTFLNNSGKDICYDFLPAIGRLFNAGGQPQIRSLYPPVQWPVSRGTPGISSHIGWDHSQKWRVPHYTDYCNGTDNRVKIDLAGSYSFLTGYNIHGRIVFPPSGILKLVWQHFLHIRSVSIDHTPVVFEEIDFVTPVALSPENENQFIITVLPNSGRFEVSVGNNIVSTGIIRYALDSDKKNVMQTSKVMNGKPHVVLDNTDVYTELYAKGYNLDEVFKGIESFDTVTKTGTLQWKNNWIPFIDSMFQVAIISSEEQDISSPNHIKKVYIDPSCYTSTKEKSVTVSVYKDVIEAEGMRIEGIQWNQETHKEMFQRLNTDVKKSVVETKKQLPNLSRSIATILGVVDLNKVSPTKSLSDLGMDSIMAAEVDHILRTDYGISMDVECILNLTFKTIEALQ